MRARDRFDSDRQLITHNRRRGDARAALAVVFALLGVMFVPSAGAAGAGELDPRFGSGGVAVVPGGGAYETVLIQEDDKILAAGFVDRNGLYFATVARFNEDGTLDPAFGDSGVATFAYGDEFHGGEVFALEPQPDGKILAGGTTNAGFALARLNSDGSLDTTFGTGGVSAPAMSEATILDLALRPDGSILAAGRIGSVFGFSGQHRLGIIRFLPDGSVDTGFGTDGLVSADFADGYLAAALFQADGSILAGGSSINFADFQLARYTPNGALDASFGSGGYVFTDFSPSDVIQGLALESNGAIVAAGASINRGDDFALARYLPDGTPDIGFGQGGKVETEFAPSDQALAYAVAVQPDGKIVTGGCARNCDRLALARYNADGSLDAGFGQGGLFASDTIADAPAIALQPDGNIVASAGGHHLLSPQGTTLVRVLGEPIEAEPFASFDVEARSKRERLRLEGWFQLGPKSNGIDPQAEDVVVTIGSFETLIPSGSFAIDGRGRYFFDGTADGTRVTMTIRVVKPNRRYEFDYEAIGPDIPQVVGATDASLRIGDDEGTGRARVR